MGTRGAGRLWALAACGPLLLVAAGVGTLLEDHRETIGAERFLENIYPNIVFGALVPFLGAVILSRLRRHPVGLLFMGCGLVSAATLFVYGYAHVILVENVGPQSVGLVLGWVSQWLWAFGLLPLVTLGFLLFPDGRLPSRRWRALVAVDCLAVLLNVLAQMFHSGNLEVDPDTANPLGIDLPDRVFTVTGTIAGACFLVGIVGSLAAVVLRWRRARGAERAQLNWFALAFALLVLGILLPGLVPALLTVVAIPLLPVAVAIAILRRNLYGFEIVVRRSLVYAALTALLLLGYAIVVTGLGALLGDRANGVVALVATALVAIAFAPLRSRLQAGADRMLYGEGGDPYAVLTGIGRRLDEPTNEDGLADVVATVCSALRLPYARIEVHADDEVLAADHGTASPDLHEVAIAFRGRTIGRLLVAPRSPGEAFRPADLRLLDDLARQIGIAAHAILLTRDLQESRESLVALREEERRRIRRDLHDGLGPALAGVALGLDAVGRLVDASPERAADLAQQLKGEVHASLADVRRLVEDLRPPALDQWGLAGALRRHGEQLTDRDPGLEVTVDADGVRSLPAAVEVAAYRIVTEALTNVARHATARHCHVGIAMEGDHALVLAVEDDGVGLPTNLRYGVGLNAMRERATELGGTCVAERAATGGTLIRARIPVS